MRCSRTSSSRRSRQRKVVSGRRQATHGDDLLACLVKASPGGSGPSRGLFMPSSSWRNLDLIREGAVQVLVSCRHCKRMVLMEQGMDLADLVRLREHLAACRPDDRSNVLRDENLLRHVRVVVVETERGTSRACRDGGAPTEPISMPCSRSLSSGGPAMRSTSTSAARFTGRPGGSDGLQQSAGRAAATARRRDERPGGSHPATNASMPSASSDGVANLLPHRQSLAHRS